MKVSVVLPCLFTDKWQANLAEFCIATMRSKTSIDFEVVVVETGSNMLQWMETDVENFCYVHRPERTCYTADFNAGIEAASGEFIVHTGMDIIVGDRWLEAMLECFERFEDCGAATLRIYESGAYVGPKDPSSTFDEAMYGPLMMFRNTWRLDEAFPDLASDSDLIMRIYEAGQRSYRNNKAMAWHLNGVGRTTEPNKEEKTRRVHAIFKQRHGDSPLWMANMIMRGGVVYGKEHER